MAANAGRVIGVGQRDIERGWDHEDFAVDALLNLGSSGSPVLAVSCQTGEPEIVGIYHAGYRNAQGLNVVIAIDELRGVLDDLRPPARVTPAREPVPDLAEARAALGRGPLMIPFGRRAVRVERQDEAVRFAVLDPSFPLSTRVEIAIVDGGAAAEGRAAELRAALWEQLGLVLRYRAEDGSDGRRRPDVRDRIATRIRRGEDEQEQLLTALRAGAEGFGQITRSERDPAAQGPPDGRERPVRGPVELILGSR
jgi:serine protease Do